MTIIKFSELDISEFIHFLKDIDIDFTPTLSSHVDFDLFANKAFLLGNVYGIKDKDKIVAAIVFYDNDITNHFGYISFVGVSSSHRRQGIAKMLVNFTIDKASSNDMHKIGIHTNNIVAKEMYTNIGFELKEETKYSDYIRYYLEYSISK